MTSADEQRPGTGGPGPAAPGPAAVAAAVIHKGRLLVVSQQAAPDAFALPGGPCGPGETAREALARRLREEVSAWPSALTLLGQFDGEAAADGALARVTVFMAVLSAPPQAGAGRAALAWTTGADDYAPRLAPALRDQVIPFLRRTGRLPGR